MNVVPIWINGKSQPLDQTRFIDVRSSAQNDAFVHFAQGADVPTAQLAVEAAASAFLAWKSTSHTKRRDVLLKVAEIYEERIDDIVTYQVEETSASKEYARFNVLLACRLVREFAGSITAALTGQVPPIASGGFGLVFKEPVGPVLIIPPWNSPIILCTRGIAAALAAGCTVVLKSSEASPRTHHFVVEAFEEAGLPVGCLNSLQAARNDAGAITEALIAHRDIKKIEFIGSANVGRIIGQTAAKYLKPVLMELGGKGPAVVLEDANLMNAARLCAFGAFLHHGQLCFSTERIIVVQSVAEEFIKLLKDHVNKGFAGSVGYSATKVGAERAQMMLNAAVSHGASFVVGDNTFTDDTRASLKPTIITNIQKSDILSDEETFGPSATLYVVADADEAIKLANESSYGLNAAIHTRDMYKALALARQLEHGQVHINSPTTFDQDTMPLTGLKGSGWGSNNGAYGIQEFLVNKSVTLHDADEAAISFGTD